MTALRLSIKQRKEALPPGVIVPRSRTMISVKQTLRGQSMLLCALATPVRDSTESHAGEQTFLGDVIGV
jgi:hypothetical protein